MATVEEQRTFSQSPMTADLLTSNEQHANDTLSRTEGLKNSGSPTAGRLRNPRFSEEVSKTPQNGADHKKKGELILTPAEALEKSKRLPKGYAIVPEVLAKKEEEPGPLPAKRERKKINYNDFVTSPKTKGKEERKGDQNSEVEDQVDPSRSPAEVGLEAKNKMKKKGLGRKKKNGFASELEPPEPPLDVSNEEEVASAGSKGRKAVDGKKKIEQSIKLLDSRLEELSRSLHSKKKKERDEESPSLDPKDSPELGKSKKPRSPNPASSRPQRTKKRRKDYGPSDYQLTPEMKTCLQILTSIMNHRLAWPFNQPVDPVALNIPDYFDIIKTPMDFGTIKKQIESGWYENYEEFADDMRLVFSNAKTYNPRNTDIWTMAHTLSDLFERKLCSAKKKMEEKTVTLEMEETISELRDSMKQVREEIRKLRQQKVQTPGSTTKTLSSKSRTPKDDQPMTFEEKKKLGDSINQLPSDKLGKVVQIIHERIPHLAKSASSDEIEIDIDVLDTETLRALERYVKSVLSKRKKKSPNVGGVAPPSTGNPETKLKQAEMSENGTAKRIMDVERKLKELNNLSQSFTKKSTRVRGKKNGKSGENSPQPGTPNTPGVSPSPQAHSPADKGSDSVSDSDSDSDSSASSSSSSSSGEGSDSSESESDGESEPNSRMEASRAPNGPMAAKPAPMEFNRAPQPPANPLPHQITAAQIAPFIAQMSQIFASSTNMAQMPAPGVSTLKTDNSDVLTPTLDKK